VLVAGLLYKGNKSKREAVIALVAGVAAMTIVMVIANMIVTPLFTGWPLSAVMEVMPFIVAFNLLKAGVNSIITFFLYKRISPFLHR